MLSIPLELNLLWKYLEGTVHRPTKDKILLYSYSINFEIPESDLDCPYSF